MPLLLPERLSTAPASPRPSWQRFLGGAPVTVSFAVAFWAVGALTLSVSSGPGPSMRAHVAATAHSLPGNWWAALTCALWAQNLGGYLLGTVLVLGVGLALEPRMGSLKFAAAGLASQVLGIGAALGFLAVTRPMSSLTVEMSGHLFLGPSALITGSLMAGTAMMPTLWRRRIRLVVFALLLLLALYSGGFAHLIRLGAAVTGALLGPVLLGRLPRFGRPVSSRYEGRVLIALLVAVSAVGPVVAGLVPHAAGPLSVLRFLFTDIEPVDPQTLQRLCSDPGQARECAAAHLQMRAGAGGIFMGILPSFLLLLFADGLRRGRRFAWAGTLLIQLVLSVLAGITIAGVIQRASPDTAAVEGIGAIEASGHAHPVSLMVPLLLPIVLSLLLLVTRRIFSAAAPSGTYARLLAQVLALGTGLAGFYLLAGLALAGGFSPVPGPAELLADVPDRFLPLGYMVDASPAYFPQSTAAVVLYEGVGVVFWAATAVLVLKTFLRPALIQHNAGAARARNILKAGEGSSLSWMTTWPGNTYWFSAAGQSFVAYRVIGGVALTTGAPVGPESDRNGAFTEFTRFCLSEGWTPCFYSVPQDLRDVAAGRGWRSVQVAQETVLPLDSISFKGKKFQDIRTAMNNAAKSGICAEWMTYATAPFPVLAQIREISEEWVADRKMPEMGFTLGGLDELNDPDVRLLLAIDSHHRVHAVLSWLPVYHNGAITGWTLDYMRRRSTGFRAGIEFLIASAALTFKEEGCGFISLSGAPLARISANPPRLPAPSEPQTAGGLDRLLDWLGATLEPVYGFRSLLAFKAKFQPHYEPLYMLYPDPASLPAIGNAVTRAYLPSINFGEGLALASRMLHRPRRRGPAERRNPAEVSGAKHMDGPNG